MDNCAELSLRIIRAGQEALNPQSSPVAWRFFPERPDVTWSDARNRLAATEKPVIIAPLLESGSVAIWSINGFTPEHRAIAEREFANQCQYFTEKLSALGFGDADHVETPDGDFRVTVPEFKRWATEYAVNVGIGMTKSPDARAARILIRPPGGGRPIGLVDP